MEIQSVSVEIGGRTMTFETGLMAKQADGAVVVRGAHLARADRVVDGLCRTPDPVQDVVIGFHAGAGRQLFPANRIERWRVDEASRRLDRLDDGLSIQLG